MLAESGNIHITCAVAVALIPSILSFFFSSSIVLFMFVVFGLLVEWDYYRRI